LELIRTLASELSGKVLLTTTVFNPWSVLRKIVFPPGSTHQPPNLGEGIRPADGWITQLLAEDRATVARALEAIGESLGAFARQCISAGADGIYLSVREDWVNTKANGPSTYTEMVAPLDRRILKAAATGRFNILHVCGQARDLFPFAEYPAQVLHWADRSAGPAISTMAGRVKPVLCCGVDHLGPLVRGTPEEVETEVADALRQAGKHPIIVAPGCTYDPNGVSPDNLRAIARAVRPAD
jgi:uroporphyrinogen-III decarboxylase